MSRFECKVLIIFFYFFLISAPLVNSESISLGISPDFLDLGEIELGESKIARFYVITHSNELFLVNLGSSRVTDTAMFNKNEYKNVLQFYSEQDPSPWINFVNNPVKLLPPSEILEKTKAGGVIKGMREISFILKVPKDAEPGYHLGEINMDPQVARGTESIGIKSTMPMRYIFKVKGNATRSGKILDITTNGIRGNRLWLKIFYKNIGTVTTFIDSGNIIILNIDGRTIGSTSTNMGYVEPGGIKEFDGFIDYSYIEEGTYPVKAKVSFITGSVEGDGFINIVKSSEIPTAKVVQGEKEKKEFPLWIIILLIIIVVVYILLKR